MLIIFNMFYQPSKSIPTEVDGLLRLLPSRVVFGAKLDVVDAFRIYFKILFRYIIFLIIEKTAKTTEIYGKAVYNKVDFYLSKRKNTVKTKNFTECLYLLTVIINTR